MSNSSVPLLSAHSITKSFGPRTARHQVLFDVSADVHAGECLAVIGGSGSGKSTLTRIMLGLESADSGSVEYESQSIVGGRKSPGFATLRRESGLVFQDPFSSLDPRWQVAKSVAEPLSLQRRDLNNTDIDERVVAALTMAGLEPADFLNRYPIDLSGGQAQRVVIARAIINEPKVILADEPMSAIDVAARIQILDTFAAIRADGGEGVEDLNARGPAEHRHHHGLPRSRRGAAHRQPHPRASRRARRRDGSHRRSARQPPIRLHPSAHRGSLVIDLFGSPL